MSKIYDFPLLFSFVKRYFVFAFKRYYGKYIVVGRENIPTDCPVIFAPNHVNALMDALAVHSIVPHNLPVVFLARADLFNNKLVAKLLRFGKIMPAFRMRDGVENLGKNHEVFDLCVEVLHHNKALGIMPEGNQGEQRKLRPIVKGIFRIAFSAQQKYGTQPAVKIVPVGIDLEDFVKFGKDIIIIIGKPIEVSEYMPAYAKNPVAATNKIRDRLGNDLSKLTLNLATQEHYECFETAVQVANTAVVEELRMPNDAVYHFVARQKIAERLVALEKKKPKKTEELELLCAEYTDCLKKMNLQTWVLEQAPDKSVFLLLDGLLLLIMLPVFVCGFILNILPFISPVVLRKALKVEYDGFFSSLNYSFGMITFPIFYILQTVLFCSFISASFWWVGMLFFITQYFFGKFAFDWYCKAKKYLAKIRYRNLERKNSTVLQQAQSLRKKIIQLIEK